MKAILEFTLPDDEREHHHAIHAQDFARALEDVRTWLRNKRKHGTLSPSARTFADEVWEYLHETLNEYGINDLIL